MRPRNFLQFGVGVLWLIIALVEFLDPSAAGSIFGHYRWLAWSIGSLGFFLGAYRRPSTPSK